MIKPNSNDFYRRFIAHLGILYMRAQYNGNQIATDYYRNIYKKLELIQEKRHLALLGEESKERILYEEIIKIVETIYQKEENQENSQVFKNTLQEIEDLLNEKYNIELEETKNEKQQSEEEKEK